MAHNRMKILFSALLHLLGILVIFVLFSSLFISSATAQLVYKLLGDRQISEQILTPVIITLGLSAVVYSTGVFLFRSLSKPELSTLKRARGAIMTETLIVLPVFLLFTSGLAQMGINSMAGLLTTVGTYEAGRTLAVWGPEIGNARINGVSQSEVSERARLAVALVVAPVATTTFSQINKCSTSPTLQKLLKGMVATGVLSTPNAGGRASIWSFSEAFGRESFATRAPAKLKSAYCSVEIDNSVFAKIPTKGTKGANFTVKVKYDHQAVFPMVSKIFSNSKISRSYVMRSHIPPNDCLPESPNFFNLGNCN